MTTNVTRKELALTIADRLQISQRNAAEIVDKVFSVMKETMVAGESVKLGQRRIAGARRRRRSLHPRSNTRPVRPGSRVRHMR